MRIVLLINVVSLLAGMAISQDRLGSIAGTIKDKTDAVIPWVSVELQLGAQRFSASADDRGAFKVGNLPAGEYSLTVSQKGFLTSTYRGITLAPNQQKEVGDVLLWVPFGCLNSPPTYVASNRNGLGGVRGTILMVRYGEEKARPVAGVEVIFQSKTSSSMRSQTTSAAGEFDFEDLPPGVYRVRVGTEDQSEQQIVPGWVLLHDLGVLLPVCPEGGCDTAHPPRRPPIIFCE